MKSTLSSDPADAITFIPSAFASWMTVLRAAVVISAPSAENYLEVDDSRSDGAGASGDKCDLVLSGR